MLPHFKTVVLAPGLQQRLLHEWVQCRHQLLELLLRCQQQLRGGLGRGYGGASGMRGITTVMVNQSLLSPLNLKVHPNIPAVHTQEKEQYRSLSNKFASFIDKVRFLEQENEMLVTKWSLLQQQRTAGSNMDNVFKSYINNLRQQLETLGLEKLKLEAELGSTQRLVEDFKNKHEDEISKPTEMENELVLRRKDADESYTNKVELESRLEGLTGRSTSAGSCMKRRSGSCSPDLGHVCGAVHGQHRG
ncbi:Keratin, type II cytoskeletal 8 [Plecturocebus cupreus]